MSSGLYRLEAFGLNNVWVRWRIAHGALDEPEIESSRARHRLFPDDFGDEESLAIARQAFPSLEIDPFGRRMHPGDRG